MVPEANKGTRYRPYICLTWHANVARALNNPAKGAGRVKKEERTQKEEDSRKEEHHRRRKEAVQRETEKPAEKMVETLCSWVTMFA